MRCNPALAALALTALPLAGVAGQTLTPSPVFKGKIMALDKNGTTQPLEVSVQTWEFTGREGALHEIPLRGFYVAHLLNGDISTTIDGQTTTHPADAYWAVKSGATMRVKVNGQVAKLETITFSKQ